MRAVLPLLSLSAVAQALYFYIDGTTPKCFYEELPKDTLVVGHYSAEEYDDQRHAWWKHEGISIFISVDVCAPLGYRTDAIPLPLHPYHITFKPPSAGRQNESLCHTISRNRIMPLLTKVTAGNFRQRAPSRLSKGQLVRQVHLHSS
jgi:hypothetical protein